MFIHTINYPDMIVSHQELNIFFDYVVHGILDEMCCNTEFYGVHTEHTPCAGHVKVEIPIKVTNPIDGQRVHDLLKGCLTVVCNNLVGTQVVPLTLSHIDVNVLIDIKPSVSVPDMLLHRMAERYLEENKEREEKTMFVPEVKEIIHRKSNRGEFFTVVWRDETTTTVKLMEGDTSDEYTAFLYALGKKMFGDKGTARKFVAEKKSVFEDRMAKKSAEKEARRREQALRQSLEAEDIDDISGQVYANMFVAPCMVSRAVFRRNQ